MGPVTLAELRAKAAAGGLNPRLDHVWTQGMADWQPAGEVDDLFEKRAVTGPAEPLAPPADPYQPPRQDPTLDAMAHEGGWPGARRRMFLIMTIVFPVLWNLGFGVGAGFLGRQLGQEIMGIIAIGAALVPVVIGVWYGLERLANVGMSRWWYLGHFVPILNFWVGYRSIACPAGYAYHKKLDGAGWALAILYWLMVVLALVAVAVVIALLVGAVNHPELRQRIGELLQTARERAAKP